MSRKRSRSGAAVATLHGLFLNLQSQLDAELQTARKAVRHPGAKGNDSEEGWRHLLSEYLPKRYSVSKAFVIDSQDRCSEEIDLVIYDRQYSPFLLRNRSSTFLPAESVYAVFEVKQQLDRGNVAAACQKAASVRALHRTCRPIVHAGGLIANPKPPFDILAGMVCLDSAWSPAFGEPLRRALRQAPVAGRLELLCSLRHGGAEVEVAADGDPRLEVSPPETALISFFLRLIARLQGLGTVPAIDLAAYERALRR